MSGWHRLFVVFCAVTALAAAFFFYRDRPTSYTAGEYVGTHCSMFDWVSQEAARQWLSAGRVLQPRWEDDANAMALSAECRSDLQEYVSGKRLARMQSDWDSQLPAYIGAWAVLVALVYGIGSVMGWVWRGFRPKQ